MAIYTNVLKEFREEVEARLTLNDVIDVLIAEKLIDEKLYAEIWGQQSNRVRALLDIVLKDANRCARFINILGDIPNLKNLSELIKTNIDKIYQMIVTGGFPEFSLNYVVRNSVANAIQEKASNLNPKICSMLVVYGLAGFGKSCLVNQVLQTKKFFEISGGAMFWINLGEYSDTTAVINPLWNLYLTAVKLTGQIALPHRPEDLAVLQNEVKRIFLDGRLANSYIILDDVKSSEVLKTFKLRCKTIVTTQDKNVANDFDAIFIQVTTGFTKKESLELLRKSLDTDNLSSKESFANRIHELCDGCPMLLNIIGSILRDSREEALSTNIIWDVIIEEIIKNDYVKHPLTAKVIHMIQMFVSCLSVENQKCFHSLAVFPKHVNIRPEILMKLWDKNYYSVRQIMVELENKSLIVSFYNKDLKTYIYSIHSLVRTYLVERKDTNIEFYHKKLIMECGDYITEAPADDPIANYMFGYYGYHAKNAKLYDKFEKYFDLRFIENKIKRVGSADLLTDFETYKDLITKNDVFLERKLDDYIKFVNSYSSHLHISPETNIVQFAFFNGNNCAFEEAKNIAGNNPDQLYFKLEPYSGIHKNFPTLKTQATAISCIFLDSKEVLIGTKSGSIEIKSFHRYQQKVQRFEGHTDQVLRLLLSPDSKSFLSISPDNTLKLWKFVEELDPQSPKLKQTNWKNLHSPEENIQPHQTFKMQDKDFIISAAFPFDNSDEIVTGSNRGKIRIWNIKTATVIKESALGLPISQICYGHDSQQIIFSYDGKVYIHSRKNLLYERQFGLFDEINDLVLLPIYSQSKDVAVMGGKKLEIWDYVNKSKRFSYELQSRFACSTISGDFLVIGSEDYIYLYNCKLQKMMHYKNDYGLPTSLYLLPDHVVLICLQNSSVQRCELYFKQSEKPLVHDLTLFSCYWKESLPIYFLINKENRVDIFNGHSVILTGIDDIVEEITYATFSLCGNYLILGTSQGNVFFYNYKTKKLGKIAIDYDSIKLIKCFEHGINHNKCELVVAACGRKLIVIMDNQLISALEISQTLNNVFYLDNCLITIDVNGVLSIARKYDELSFQWTMEKYEDVITATTHKEKNYLGFASRNVQSYQLTVIDMKKTASNQIIFKEEIYNEPKCMSFSCAAKLLAVGFSDGEIKIFNLENRAQDVMHLHKKPVEQLLFAPNFESIFVSLGDQIALWNVENFLEPEKKSDRLLVFNFDPWRDKKLHDMVPYLLISTNLHGKQLRYISASKDFKSFLVIDLDGNIFKIDVINS